MTNSAIKNPSAPQPHPSQAAPAVLQSPPSLSFTPYHPPCSQAPLVGNTVINWPDSPRTSSVGASHG